MSRILRSTAMLVAVAAFAGAAQAQYSQTLPEFSGPFHDIGSAFPFGPFAVGTYTGIPSGTISSATISGTFGNTAFPNSAPARVYLGSTLVAQCFIATTCGSSPVPTPWTFAFNPLNFFELAGPTADLTVWQDNFYTIRLGPTALDIEYATVVPEPASLALLAIGLIGLVPTMRRKLKKQ